jgi:surface antigen/peptidoglycan hydrolase CwlO-like protein
MLRDILSISINKTKAMQNKISKKSNRYNHFRLPKPLAALALCALMVAAGATPLVRADQFDQQIQALQAQNSGVSATVDQLQSQANSYQGAINQLSSQIGGLQSQITSNQTKQADLAQQIIDKQNDITHQRAVLGDDVKAMYVDGQISTIEQLATSKDLSDFVDKQEYRNTVQSKIQDTLKQITLLQQQLQSQKVQVDQLLADQKTQQSQLASAQAQQSNLLAFNQSQQASFTQQIQANSGKIADLRKQQIAANARFIGNAGTGPACGGGYPAKWCEVGQDTVFDSWGMYNRECVSYTAFRVAASSRTMPPWGWNGAGNANQWDDDARSAGIPVDGTPRAGDVAISNSGAYGHAMYVESVNSNGTINISQYNAALDGRYSTNTISVGSLVFIHF